MHRVGQGRRTSVLKRISGQSSYYYRTVEANAEIHSSQVAHFQNVKSCIDLNLKHSASDGRLFIPQNGTCSFRLPYHLLQRVQVVWIATKRGMLNTEWNFETEETHWLSWFIRKALETSMMNRRVSYNMLCISFLDGWKGLNTSKITIKQSESISHRRQPTVIDGISRSTRGKEERWLVEGIVWDHVDWSLMPRAWCLLGQTFDEGRVGLLCSNKSMKRRDRCGRFS